jgi:hypothetical protein
MSGSMGPDDGFERLLRGETPKTPEEQSLGLFLEDVRGAFPTEPPFQEGAQLAAIVQAAQLLADNGEPSVRSATEAGRRVPGRPMRRRVIVKLPLMRSLAAKVVAGLVVLMSMFGGLALAGALPGQGSDDDAVEIQEVSDEAPETEAPETEDADDQGEDADDQGEDADDQGEDADDQGENEDADDADDQGENEDADVDADDQGENEDADDQGENEDADDQGENEDADDQGDDADDQGEDADQGEDD